MVHRRAPGREARLLLCLVHRIASTILSDEDLLAENEGLLAVNPDTHNAAVFVIVVVACCPYPHPDEPAVGQNWSQSRQERRTWKRGKMINYLEEQHEFIFRDTIIMLTWML